MEKQTEKLNIEISLNDLRDAIATLSLISLATTSEGSVERITQGIDTAAIVMRSSLDDLAKSLGHGENFFLGEDK